MFYQNILVHMSDVKEKPRLIDRPSYRKLS